MIDLKTACIRVLTRNPGKRIVHINEHLNVYQFTLLNKEEKIGPMTNLMLSTLVYKKTGEILDDVLLHEDITDDFRYVEIPDLDEY